jgi:hypothetical protein
MANPAVTEGSIIEEESYRCRIILCRYCKQSINKDVDDYVVMRHAARPLYRRTRSCGLRAKAAGIIWGFWD